jgi:hypothetical protein
MTLIVFFICVSYFQMQKIKVLLEIVWKKTDIGVALCREKRMEWLRYACSELFIFDAFGVICYPIVLQAFFLN